MSSSDICTACGHLGETRVKTRGSILIEILAWCLFLIPGIFYSLWRHSSRVDVCAKCGSEALIGVDTPRGRKLLDEFHPETPFETVRPHASAIGAGRALGRAVGGLLRKT